MPMKATVLGIWMFFALGAVAPGQAVDTIGPTPPRLSLVEGSVAFWRPGAQGWVDAAVNTALAPGDGLHSGSDSHFECQIGAGAFLRGGSDTQIGMESLDAEVIRFDLLEGEIVIDWRAMEPGQRVVVATPHTDLSMASEGYYRIGVDSGQTRLIVRRQGRATAMAPEGAPIHIGADQVLWVDGHTPATVTIQTAPPTDDWDGWNDDRTGQLLETESARYVDRGAYGLRDLDRYGTWAVVPTYGPVWRPGDVGTDWAPYRTGVWMRDPYYHWTWVDRSPWGWAPYHYGRWVHVRGHWCWAPGPRTRRPVYAPALVAFFGVPGLQTPVQLGKGSAGWVSLGWGEPLIPWWGHAGFIHRPWWAGWSGPRYINRRPVHHGATVRLNQITDYTNARMGNALVTVDRHHFDRISVPAPGMAGGQARHWRSTDPGMRMRPLPSRPPGPRDRYHRQRLDGQPSSMNPSVDRFPFPPGQVRQPAPQPRIASPPSPLPLRSPVPEGFRQPSDRAPGTWQPPAPGGRRGARGDASQRATSRGSRAPDGQRLAGPNPERTPRQPFPEALPADGSVTPQRPGPSSGRLSGHGQSSHGSRLGPEPSRERSRPAQRTQPGGSTGRPRGGFQKP